MQRVAQQSLTPCQFKTYSTCVYTSMCTDASVQMRVEVHACTEVYGYMHARMDSDASTDTCTHCVTPARVHH